MLTTVANSLFDRLIEAMPPNRPYGRETVKDEAIPEPVGTYIHHLLDVKLKELEENDLPNDAWVDAYAAEVKESRQRYVEALTRHQAVPALEWADVLRTACHDTLQFLVRPARKLTDVVFDAKASMVQSTDVMQRIGFYGPYPYFRNVIEAYFRQKETSRIDRQRFEGLVLRTDRQMTADFSPKQWRRLLEPLVEVLSAAGRSDVPIDLLKTFLEEKEATGPLRALKSRYGLQGVVAFRDLEEVFVPLEEPAAAPKAGADRRLVDERPAAKGRSEGSVPLWKQFEHGYQPKPEAEPAREHAEKASGPSEPLWKQFRKTPEAPAQQQDGSLADLERSVLGDRGAKNRALFVKHLFSGQMGDYESTLRRLAQADSWSQASQIIAKEIFLKHQVNIYSDPAVTFTDAAEAQYRN